MIFLRFIFLRVKFEFIFAKFIVEAIVKFLKWCNIKRLFFKQINWDFLNFLSNI